MESLGCKLDTRLSNNFLVIRKNKRVWEKPKDRLFWHLFPDRPFKQNSRSFINLTRDCWRCNGHRRLALFKNRPPCILDAQAKRIWNKSRWVEPITSLNTSRTNTFQRRSHSRRGRTGQVVYALNSWGWKQRVSILQKTNRNSPHIISSPEIIRSGCHTHSFSDQYFDGYYHCIYRHFGTATGYCFRASRILKPGGHLSTFPVMSPLKLKAKLGSSVSKHTEDTASFINSCLIKMKSCTKWRNTTSSLWMYFIMMLKGLADEVRSTLCNAQRKYPHAVRSGLTILLAFDGSYDSACLKKRL